MADILIAELVPNAKNGGGTYVDGVPWRLVFHTTETERAPGAARRLAKAHANPPHLWYDWEHDELVQSVPLNRSAFALARTTDLQTNKMRAIQCELLGRAAAADGWGPVALERIARRVVVPARDALERAYGSTFALSALDTVGPEGYGANAPQRLTAGQWRTFGGVLAHQHVPTNSHWDAGRLNLHRICELAAGAGDELEEDDMPGPSAWTREDWLAYDQHVEEQRLQDRIALSGSQVSDLAAKVTNLGDVINQGSAILAAVAGLDVNPADVDVAALAAKVREGLGDEVARAIGRALVA